MTSIVKPYVLANKPLPFGQLNLELHMWNKEFHDFLSWWEMLEAAGLRPFMTEVSCYSLPPCSTTLILMHCPAKSHLSKLQQREQSRSS